MKLSGPLGEVELSMEEYVQLISVYEGKPNVAPNATKRKRRRRNNNKLSMGNQTTIYNYLCENDSESGCQREDISNATGIPVGSVSAVITLLKRKGYAYAIAPATYRIVQKEVKEIS